MMTTQLQKVARPALLSYYMDLQNSTMCKENPKGEL